MAKTKTPFFGLGAHGTVGGSITAQALPKDTLLRSKPLPTYRYTLPQAYQRWLYEDYAYLWRQQTPTVQAQYRTAGVPYHLTAFQYWMKYNLTNLPDIAAWWKLDDNLGPTVTDSSRNTNIGTIIGASPAAGLINNALLFDGLNDYVPCGTAPSLNFDSPLTFETLIYLNSSKTHAVISQTTGGDLRLQFLVLNTDRPHFAMTNTPAAWDCNLTASIPLSLLTWHHIAAVYTGTTLHLYIDGIQRDGAPAGAVPANIRPSASPLMLARQTTLWGHCYLDNPLYYNRALDATEILRHSLRRYPPQ